jgi:hypothetical protein
MNFPLTDKVIRIVGKSGKYEVTRNYMDHGHVYIDYRPLDSNEDPLKAAIEDLQITVVGRMVY